MIELRDLVKKFGELTAVNRVSLTVDQGQVCVLIGPSGSGKTTLLRMVNRLIEQTSGKIWLDGKDTSQIKPEVLRRSIGYSIQNVGLFPHMTVAANIGVVPALLHWKKTRIETRVMELLELVGLDPAIYGRKYPAELSGGEAQRIGVARALAGDPPVLLMDEPFGAVDPLTRQKLQLEFSGIQKRLKKTVILVTHDMDEAIRLADKIAILKSGRLVQYDSPEVMLAKPVDKFVYDFIGADRALKRLSRMSIEPFIKPACSINIQASVQQARELVCDLPFLWVVNEKGEFLGWAKKDLLSDYANIGDATNFPNVEEISISITSTLRDGLSLMLGNGVKSLPVVDAQHRLVGELTLKDIEEASAQEDAKNAQ